MSGILTPNTIDRPIGVGDCVRVVAGPYSGRDGRVTSLGPRSASLQLDSGEQLRNVPLIKLTLASEDDDEDLVGALVEDAVAPRAADLPDVDPNLLWHEGDRVRVMSGKYAGRLGTVIGVNPAGTACKLRFVDGTETGNLKFTLFAHVDELDEIPDPPLALEMQPVHDAPDAIEPLWRIGDQAHVNTGKYIGKMGIVVAVNLACTAAKLRLEDGTETGNLKLTMLSHLASLVEVRDQELEGQQSFRVEPSDVVDSSWRLGAQVHVNSGKYVGHVGTVVAVNSCGTAAKLRLANGTETGNLKITMLTPIASSDDKISCASLQQPPVMAQTQAAAVIVGDRVKVRSGKYMNRVGTVTGVGAAGAVLQLDDGCKTGNIKFAQLLALGTPLQCCICLDDDVQFAKGLFCLAVDPAAAHFTCETCFSRHVQVASRDEVARVRARRGEICCPVTGCPSIHFHAAVVAQHVSEETFNAYMLSWSRLREDDVAKETEERVRTEAAASRQRDWHSSLVHNASQHIREVLLTLCCPRCHVAFMDFDGCFALKCSACPCAFCAWCLADCGDDAHYHVLQCSEREADGYFHSQEVFVEHHRKRRAAAAVVFLASLDDDVEADVRAACNVELATFVL